MRDLRWAALVAATSLACLAGCVAGSVPAAPDVAHTVVGPVDLASYAREVVLAVNRARADSGLPALATSACVAREALARARRLVRQNSLEHAPLDTVMAACPPAASAGENLSRGVVTPEGVVAAWMDSPGHRSNILNRDFRHVGVGCAAAGTDEILCSAVFIAPK